MTLDTNLASYLKKQYLAKYKNVKPNFGACIVRANELRCFAKSEEQLALVESYYKKALKLVNNNTYARSQVYYDLAEFYFYNISQLPGEAYQYLLMVESFLKHAIENAEKSQFTEMYAQSLSRLAVLYRRAATEVKWHKCQEDCLCESISLHKRALSTLSNSLPSLIKLNQLATIKFNLANALYDQGLIEEACNNQAEAFNNYREAMEFLPSSSYYIQLDLSPLEVFPTTFSRLSYFSNQVNHKAVCEEIIQIAPEYKVKLLDLRLDPLKNIYNPQLALEYMLNKREKKKKFYLVS